MIRILAIAGGFVCVAFGFFALVPAIAPTAVETGIDATPLGYAEGDVQAPDAQPRPTTRSPRPGEESAKTGQGQPNRIVQINRADRNVTPLDMTHGPVASGPLKRIAPRGDEWAPTLASSNKAGDATPSTEKTPDETGVKPKPTLEPLRTRRQVLLQRPIVEDTAHLKIGAATVVLPGIAPLPLDSECGTGTGTELWPCGMQARTALRNYLRSRSIRCLVPPDFGTKEEKIETACTVGGGDIGSWLIQNGWAKAGADGTYGEPQERAEKARRGIWGARPGVGATGSPGLSADDGARHVTLPIALPGPPRTTLPAATPRPVSQ